MVEARATPPCSVHDAREDYFAGKISAEEYLRRALLTQTPKEPDSMVEQFRRIFARLGRKDRQNP